MTSGEQPAHVELGARRARQLDRVTGLVDEEVVRLLINAAMVLDHVLLRVDDEVVAHGRERAVGDALLSAVGGGGRRAQNFNNDARGIFGVGLLVLRLIAAGDQHVGVVVPS